MFRDTSLQLVSDVVLSFYGAANFGSGVDYGVKSVDVDGFEVRVNFWDLSGHAEFFQVRNEFYRETQGALLVFDVTSRRSFVRI